MKNQMLFDADPHAAQRGGGDDMLSAVAGRVPDSFLIELILRHLARQGELKLFEVAERMGMNATAIDALLVQMRSQQILEVPRRGAVEGDISYSLTENGQRLARLAQEKCQYVGPAPVTLDEYSAQVALQSVRHSSVKAGAIKRAMADLVMDEALLPTLGGAMNSGKAIYIYGHSGTGKTYLAEHLVKTLEGHIWVPYAIYVHGEVIQVFDPVVHQPVHTPSLERSLTRDLGSDGRWVQTRRPVVVTGGELMLATLDLEYHPHTHVHVAPPQLKANNGIFVIDDLGRQRVTARELMNRWIVPLDRHVDYLTLNAGGRLQVPFDVKVIFSSNLAPEDLVDPAFARRLGYKLHVPAMQESAYRRVVDQACARTGIEPDPRSIDFLVNTLHPRDHRPYLPCVPFDVIAKVADHARYLDQPPRMTPQLLEWAWHLYFGPPEVSVREMN